MTSLQPLFITAQTSERYGNLHEYFSNSRFQVEYLPYLLGIILIFAFCIWLGLRLIRIGMKRQDYTPRGSIASREDILVVLNQCIDQRVRMDFQFETESTRHIFATSMPVDIQGNDFVMECNASTVPVFALDPERVLQFYFSLKDKDRYLHYQFETKIVFVTPEKNSFLDLHVAIPDLLSPGQKRNFLRIDPPEKLVLDMSIWPVVRNNENKLESIISNWGKPALVYLHEDAKQFALSDISSNGVRIVVPKEYSEMRELALGKARYFSLLLDLWDPIQQAPLQIWTLCRVQKSMHDFETQDLEVGAQFVAWGVPMPENPDVLRWNKLDSQDEITILGDWIIQRHLEEYRDKSHTSFH